MKFTAKIGVYADTYETPKGNSYIFFRDKPTKVTDKDDIEYFKKDSRFQEYNPTAIIPAPKKKKIKKRGR